LWGVSLYVNDSEVDISSERITSTYEVIGEIEKLPSLIDAMLANHQAYVLTSGDTFQERYDALKADFLESAVRVSERTKENPEQEERLTQIHQDFEGLALALEGISKKYREKAAKLTGKEYAADLAGIATYKEKILQNSENALKEEQMRLRERISALNSKKRQYLQLLLAGGGGIALLIFLFNAGLLYNQTRRLTAEQYLKDSEERFVLALEGTNDGIFDWNLKNDKVFFSRQFFKMLGEDRDAYIGTIHDFKKLLHPDDQIKVWQYMERYLHRELAEYSNTYRMQHANGNWIWVQSRAKAVF
jgi:PAS domain S-box-containing protein